MAYKKGESGNPSGRPKSDTAGLKPLLAKHGKDVLQVVIDAALIGDLVACKLVLDRLYPAIKPSSATVNIAPAATLVETGNNVLSATLGGEVAPDVGCNLLTSLSNQGKLVELHELTARIEILENAEKTS